MNIDSTLMRLALMVLLATEPLALRAAEPTRTFESELARLAGRSAKQCGIFRAGREGRTGDDARAGWQCALEATRKGVPYWFAVEGRGDDSMFGVAAIRTMAGENMVLDFDSDPTGSHRDHPTFRTAVCKGAIVFLRANRPLIECE